MSTPNNSNGRKRDRLVIFQGGIAVLLLLTIGTFGYLTNENTKSTDRIEKKQDAFINKWENRIKITNIVNNSTQAELLDLANNTTFILEKLVESEKDIIDAEKSLQGNLTDHRIIQNLSKTEILDKIDRLADALNVNITEDEQDLEKLFEEFVANHTS